MAKLDGNKIIECSKLFDYNSPDYNFDYGTLWKYIGAIYTIHGDDIEKNDDEEIPDYWWGLSDYPIFDENYRPILNRMIKDHFCDREIGFETVGLFRRKMRSKMFQIMPKYNIMFNARKIVVENDPLLDHDYWITHDEKVETDEDRTQFDEKNQNDKAHEQGTSRTTTRHLDTPQNDLGNMTIDGIANNYLTDGQIDDGTYTRDNTYTSNITDDYVHRIDNDRKLDYTQHHSGRKASFQSLAMQLYETAQDIEALIMKELEPLFMGLYL